MRDSRRVVAARAVAALGAVFWGFLFFGLQDTLSVFVEGADFAADYILESGWGMVFLVLVALPLGALAVRPGDELCVWTVVGTGVALAVGALLAGSPLHLLPAAGVVLSGVLSAWLGGSRPTWRTPRQRPLLALAVVGLGPSLWYAVRMARSGPGEVTWGLDHYPVQAALGLALVLAVVTLSAPEQGSGASLLAVCVALAACWIGTESLIWPERAGSVGTVGGVLLALWGLLVPAAVRWGGGVRRQASATRSA